MVTLRGIGPSWTITTPHTSCTEGTCTCMNVQRTYMYMNTTDTRNLYVLIFASKYLRELLEMHS